MNSVHESGNYCIWGEFPDFNVYVSGEENSLYPINLRKIANKIVGLELVIYNEATITGIRQKRSKLERNGKKKLFTKLKKMGVSIGKI